tara:strand:+ start:121 stop:1110 length:990 start_codon:yes stop_codon:yes gene_type:complete
MTNKDQYSSAIEYLYNFSQLLLKNNIKHWLECGTLLHGYRDGEINSASVTPRGVSDSDNKLNEVDFDLSLLHRDYNRVKELLESNNIHYYTVKDGWLIRLDQTMHCNDMWTDLYFHQDRRGTLVSNIFRAPTSKYFVEELDEMTLYDWKFPIPRYTEKFLRTRYAETWSTPMTLKYHRKVIAETNENLFREGKTTGYLDGVWDLFHRGHLELLKRANNMYNRVVVGVCLDEDVKKHKRSPIIPHNDRVEMLKACRYVDEVYENAPWDPSLEFLEKNNFDYILHAVNDTVNWKSEMKLAYREEIINSEKFHYLSNTKYHTTDIINNILKL